MALDNPAGAAAKLKSGELDLAMIPSVEYLKEANHYRLLPDFVIASRGPVATVLFAAKTHLESVRSIAIDNRSKTSAALLRILFADSLAPDVQYLPAHPNPAAMLAAHDAALVIGDQAFMLGKSISDNATVYDLSEEWFKRTGKTFVHAVVAVRPEIKLSKEILSVFSLVRGDILREIPRIADTSSRQLGIDATICEDYLRNKIVYDFGKNAMEGLSHFRDLCVERGLIEQKHPLRFIDTP